MKVSLLLTSLVMFSFTILLSSCNTWVGMGRDFQRLGGGVQRLGAGIENQAYKNSGYQAPVAPPAQ